MSDMVNHPAHYGGDTPYEPIKVIRAWGLPWALGDAVKYIARAGKKNPDKEIEDLEKAVFYINDQIAALKRERDGVDIPFDSDAPLRGYTLGKGFPIPVDPPVLSTPVEVKPKYVCDSCGKKFDLTQYSDVLDHTRDNQGHYVFVGGVSSNGAH